MDRITSIKPSLAVTAIAFSAIAAATPALALNAGLGLGTSAGAGVNASTNGTLVGGPANIRADAAADMGATSNDSVNSNNSGALIRGNSDMSGSAGANSGASVHSVMPMGRHDYTYYPGANTYMSSNGMYYYRVGNQWRGSRTKPDVTLTGGQKVYINGTGQ